MPASSPRRGALPGNQNVLQLSPSVQVLPEAGSMRRAVTSAPSRLAGRPGARTQPLLDQACPDVDPELGTAP